MDGSDDPQNPVIDFSIIVCDDMTLSDNFSPGDFGMSGFENVRYFSRGLADDFDSAFDGVAENFVGHILLLSFLSDITRDGLGSFEHVQKICGIFRRHRSPAAKS